MTNIPDKIDCLIQKATECFEEIKSGLSRLFQFSMEDEDSSDHDKMLVIQLILQYRLSNEDALRILLNMDHNLLYYLGIQPLNSANMNRDRLAYAVGHEDLKQILNVLAILTGSLSKIVERYKNSHASFALKRKEEPKKHMMLREASELMCKQNQFIDVIHDLDLEIEQLAQVPSTPVVLEEPSKPMCKQNQCLDVIHNLDLEIVQLAHVPSTPITVCIVALREKIHHLHQAIILNHQQAEQLYQHVNKTRLIEYQLHSLLQKSEEVLNLMPGIYTPHPGNPIKQFDHSSRSEQLEHRATAKRLSPFFGK